MTPQTSGPEDQSPETESAVTSPLWWGVVVAVLAVLGVGYYFLAQAPSPAPEVHGTPQRVRIGIAMQPTDALTFVALENGYFHDLGLSVVVKKYPSGKRALQEGLFTGDVDLASTADAPVAMAGLDNKEYKILTTIFFADNVNRVIARRDRGIETASDLAGKRIATQYASAVHFFLHLFLLDHQLHGAAVEQSFMKAELLPGALAAGDIDAFSMREPYISRARELLGDNAVVFAAPGLYAQVEVLVGTPGFVDANPEVIEKVLRGLARAETFIHENPGAAMEITSRWLEVSKADIAAIWPTVSFRMDLGQALLLLLENEARWAIDDEISTAKDVPYFLDFIDTKH
ncbi:ABC transporter substrate-binding protein, partial [Pseudomonadota bacterium]